MDPIHEQRTPEVLPGLTSEELRQTVSMAIVFAVVAGILVPAVQRFLEPAAARVWRALLS